MKKIMTEEKTKMKVTGLTMDPFTNMPIVILKDDDEKIALPIWIGLVEASSIATELEEVELSRPMTHDLMRQILERLDTEVESIEIYDLSDKTFFAKIHFQQGNDAFSIDCRPSDALALALRCDADIWVLKHVIEKSRKLQEQADENGDSQAQKWTEILENLTPEDFGKYKM